jgi:hypothetical protein
MWANQPMPPRTSRSSKGSDSTRGAPRGAPRGRGRGARSGRGGTGGRSSNDKGPATPAEGDGKKTEIESSKEQAPSIPEKTAAPPSPITPSQPQTNGSAKSTNRPKPPRKNSEQQPPRKQASLNVDTLNATPSVTSTSPSLSPRTPSRRKRSQAHKTAPPPSAAPTARARKQSVTSEQGSTHVEKPAPTPAKDLPPHMAPPPVNVPTADIAHNIDALVERVRAVAMDRPHTPGNHSHFDWAEDDEDDSLPDLDDWGVTSSLSTNGPITEVTDSEKVGISVISPILPDALRPLPSVVDADVSTPSIKLHDVKGVEVNPRVDTEDGTPKGDIPTKIPSGSEEKNVPPASHDVNSNEQGHTSDPTERAELPASPLPHRRMNSIHPSRSIPASLDSRRVPHPPRGSFAPSHNRAHTLGRLNPESHSDSDRPQRHDMPSHGRNHSTPHTGPGTATAHARSTHHSRPVISGDAISRLARSLGGASAVKRGREAPAAASNPAE